jgi:hypothetical protein
MTDDPMADAILHVQASARALDLHLDPEQAARVAAVFARNAEVAAIVQSFDVPDDAPPAAIFRP